MDGLPSITFSASRPPTPIEMTPSASTIGVWLSVPTQVSGKATLVANLNHRRHLFEVDLMHDAVARWDDVHIVKGRLGPVNEMETVFIPSLFDCAVFRKHFLRNRRIPPPVSGRRSIGSGRPVHLGRVAALISNGISQTRQIYQRGLAQNVVTDNPGRIPGKSSSRLRSISCFRQAVRFSGWQCRTRFSARMREVYGSFSNAPGSMSLMACRASKYSSTDPSSGFL